MVKTFEQKIDEIFKSISSGDYGDARLTEIMSVIKVFCKVLNKRYESKWLTFLHLNNEIVGSYARNMGPSNAPQIRWTSTPLFSIEIEHKNYYPVKIYLSSGVSYCGDKRELEESFIYAIKNKKVMNIIVELDDVAGKKKYG